MIERRSRKRGRRRLPGQLVRRRFRVKNGISKEFFRRVVRLQKRFDLFAQPVVLRTQHAEQSASFVGLFFEDGVKNGLYMLPAIRRHQAAPRVSSRLSHARATVQSRLIVAGDTPITSAVSSRLSPAKNRSSTMRLWRGSISASVASASSSAARSRSLFAAAPR